MSKDIQEIERLYYKALDEIRVHHRGRSYCQREALSFTLEKQTVSRLRDCSNVVVSGISGSGKTSITNFLEEIGFQRLPSVTMRAQRMGEKKDYIFTTETEFNFWKGEKKLFYPHRRNGVWHAILNEHMNALKNEGGFYIDKSIASTIKLTEEIASTNFTFIYILAPSFQELYRRICFREKSLYKMGKRSLSTEDILDRFLEEIDDMKKSIQLPYAYVVNDSLQRIERLLKKSLASKYNT